MGESQVVSAIYQGIQYNITKIINNHPGGSDIIHKFLSNTKDISGYFKAIHSHKAQQQLLNCQQIRRLQRSKMQKVYVKIQQQIKRYYKPNYLYQYLYIIIIILQYLLAVILTKTYFKIVILSTIQIFSFWVFHSNIHIDQTYLSKKIKIITMFIGGLSINWWRKKHFAHHIFTNCYDQDRNTIPRSVLKYPFIIFLWKIQSLFHVCKNILCKQALIIFLHYLLFFKLFNLIVILNAYLISSFVINIILTGNHENEIIYCSLKEDFINHQIQATSSYSFSWIQKNQFINIITGSYIYHTQHHLFPKVPFYYLSKVSKVISEQLNKYNKFIKEKDFIQ